MKPGSLAEQIKQAQKALAQWPAWMRNTGQTVPEPEQSSPSCRHCGHELPCGCWPH